MKLLPTTLGVHVEHSVHCVYGGSFWHYIGMFDGQGYMSKFKVTSSSMDPVNWLKSESEEKQPKLEIANK